MAVFGEPVRREEGGVGAGAGGVDVNVDISGGVVGEVEGCVGGSTSGVLGDFEGLVDDRDGEIVELGFGGGRDGRAETGEQTGTAGEEGYGGIGVNGR